MEDYKEKLKLAEERYNSTNSKEEKEFIESLFPELKENEDEKIKGLSAMRDIHKHQTFSDDAIDINDAISWLEKQGEQKSTDKIESKFKVGDWITNGEYTWKVTDIKPLDYILQSQNGDVVDDTISHVNEHFHLWTIQDAKDGDVLAVKDERAFIFKGFTNITHPNYPVAYCGIDTSNHLYISDNSYWTTGKVTPSTKEQRDLLFSKMKEAGYEWDAEKKELKKIEQKPTEDVDLPEFESYLCLMLQKFRTKGMCTNDEIIDYVEEHSQKLRDILVRPVWSEEDEANMDAVWKACGQVYGTKYQNILGDWLKSIKPQKHWKPSKEQLKMLWNVIYYVEDDINSSFVGGCMLESLYKDLKKL